MADAPNWARVLDHLERQMARQERAFVDGDVADAIVPVAPSEAMTPAERVRAHDLLLRTDALLDRTIEAVRARPDRAVSPYS